METSALLLDRIAELEKQLEEQRAENEQGQIKPYIPKLKNDKALANLHISISNQTFSKVPRTPLWRLFGRKQSTFQDF